MTYLKGRLKAVFDLIKDGAFVVDIGTDHAFLPIALHLSKKAKRVIACDIKEKPLNSARKNLDKAGCTLVETRLCNGLSGIKQGEADTIVVAGMGGEVISEILFSCEYIKDSNLSLILQPMTSAGFLRERLYGEGFCIEKEVAVKENGKVYSVISAKFCGQVKQISPKEYFVGKIEKGSEFSHDYFKKQLLIIDDCLISFKRTNKQDEYDFYSTAKKEILKLLED